MPILKVKNPDGSWSDIPALIGPKGSKGDKGDKGPEGKTPVRGTDYWTPTDIAEIESYIDNAVVDTFGKGTSIPSGADLNEYVTIGKYYANAGSVAASLVNCPTKNNFMMYVFTRTTDGVPSQMIIDLSGKLYLRSRSTSTWQSWVTYITKSDLTSALAEALQDAKESGDFAGDSKVAYAICDTAAATAAKVAAISGNDSWTLQVGSIVMVYFSISNTAKNVTLNVNDSGAYPIWYNNAEYASNGTAYTGYAKRVIEYMFNGTHWVWMGASYDSNTTYKNVSLGHGYATCSTAAATAAKVGTLASYALTLGGIVAVKFTYDVPANATLNINSKGAKNIFYRGAKITAGVIKAGDIATFIYDGTQYQLLSVDRWQNDIATLQTDKADKAYLISVFGELKTAIAESNIDAAIAILDNAILDLSALS